MPSPLNIFFRNIWREYTLCLQLKPNRLKLPQLLLNALYPQADKTPVQVTVLPQGYGVPEYLAELTKTLPVAHLAGSNMAIYSPVWQGPSHKSFELAMQKTAKSLSNSHWETDVPRG